MSLPPYLDPRLPNDDESGIGWDDATREFPATEGDVPQPAAGEVESASRPHDEVGADSDLDEPVAASSGGEDQPVSAPVAGVSADAPEWLTDDGSAGEYVPGMYSERAEDAGDAAPDASASGEPVAPQPEASGTEDGADARADVSAIQEPDAGTPEAFATGSGSAPVVDSEPEPVVPAYEDTPSTSETGQPTYDEIPPSYPPADPPAPIEHPADEAGIDSILAADDPQYSPPAGNDSVTTAFQSPYDTRNLAFRPDPEPAHSADAGAGPDTSQPGEQPELQSAPAQLSDDAAPASSATPASPTPAIGAEQDPHAADGDGLTQTEMAGTASADGTTGAAGAAGLAGVAGAVGAATAGVASAPATAVVSDPGHPYALDDTAAIPPGVATARLPHGPLETESPHPIPPAPTKVGFWRHFLGVFIGIVLTPVGVWLWQWGSNLVGVAIARFGDSADPFGIGLIVTGSVLLFLVALLGRWTPAVPLAGGLVWALVPGIVILIAPQATFSWLQQIGGDRSWAFILDYWQAGMRGYLLVVGLILIGAGLAAALSRRAGRRYGDAFARYTLRSGRDF